MRPALVARNIVISLLATGLAASCKSGDKTPTQPGGNNFTISIGLSSSSLSVVQGANGSATVTLTRGGGYTGTVAISVEGAPSGATAAADPASLGSGSTTSSLTIAVGASVDPGTYTLTVRASGSAVTDATATLTLTVTAAPTPAFSLAIAPASLSVQQGADGTAAVNITRSGGFTGAVALSVAGLPSGVTANLDPESATGASSTLTISAGASVAPGDYTVTVQGTGTGVANQQASLSLTVTAASVGSYTLALDPASLSIQRGASGNATVNITRMGGFADAVALAVSGMPSGMTASANPASTTGDNATISVTVGAAVAEGNYSLTVTGTATGLADQTASLAVTVTPVSTGGGNVSWTFCADTGLPLWVAYQDGTGPWTQVSGSNNTYSFNIGSGKGAVAFVIQDATGQYSTSVYYASQTELGTIGSGRCTSSSTTTKTVNGSVAGLSATDQASVALGGAFASVSGAGPATFTLQNVPEGMQDLLAARIALNIGAGGSFTYTVNKLIIRRDLDPTNGSTLPVLDFGSAEAFDPETHTLTINNLNTDQALVSMGYFTANGTAGTFFTDIAGSGPSRSYPGVPAAHQADGDLHLLTVTAAPGGTTVDNTRSLLTMFKTAEDKTVSLGPTMGSVTVTAAATSPYARLRAQYSIQPEYNTILNVGYGQTNGASALLLVTSGYQGGNTAFDFTIPDFSAVSGWNNAWGLVPGVQTTWFLTGSSWSTAGGILTSPYQEGGQVLIGGRTGTIVP